MSGREGHDALALQRLHVLQLLGAVTGEVEDGGCEYFSRDAEDDKEDMTKHSRAADDVEDGISDHSRAADDVEDGISDHCRAADDVEDGISDHSRAADDVEDGISDHCRAADDVEDGISDHSRAADDVEDGISEHLSKGTGNVEDSMNEHYCRPTKDSLANVKSNFQHKIFKRKSGFVHNNLHSNDLHVNGEESPSSDLTNCKKQKHNSSEHVSCSSYSPSQADHSSESGSSSSLNSSFLRSPIHINSSFTYHESDVSNNTVESAGECEMTNNHTSSKEIYEKKQTNTSEVCISASTTEERSSPAVNKEKATSECMEDLLKRARAFSSQRVEITDSMFTSVTERNYERAMEPLSEQQYIPTCHETSVTFLERILIKDVNTNAVFDGSELRASECDYWQYNFCSPTMVAEYGQHYRTGNNYTKGCKWSPDGELLLVLSADQKLRLFDLPPSLSGKMEEQAEQCMRDQPAALTITEGEMVYDFTWYPLMNTQDPDTCIMVCSCRGLPMHMWDCITGQLVCSYRPFNHLDELAPAFSLGFSRDGAQLVCGFNKIIRIFETARPGRTCRELCAKRQNGIISCFDFHPHLHNVLAAGSYLGSVGLYSTGTGKVFSILEGHRGGLTQLCFSDDGLRLYTGARKDPELLCWDVRQLGRVLSSHQRVVDTHQRVSFALTRDGRTLISGSTDGRVLCWPTGSLDAEGRGAADCFVAHDDCVNGVSAHPRLPLLATSSGQRRVAPHPDDAALGCADPAADALTVATPAAVRLWRLRSTL